MLCEDCDSRQVRKALIEEFPYLMPRNVFTDKIPEGYDYTYFQGEYSLPDGWLQLFLQACEDIKEPLIKADYLEKFRFTQIKEKYGALRMYNAGAPKEVHDILAKYEFLSEQVCCICGKPATAMTCGYICPYCEEHLQEELNKSTESIDPVEIKTSYTKETYHAGNTTKTMVDCNDEWNRYLKRIGYMENK